MVSIKDRKISLTHSGLKSCSNSLFPDKRFKIKISYPAFPDPYHMPASLTQSLGYELIVRPISLDLGSPKGLIGAW